MEGFTDDVADPSMDGLPTAEYLAKPSMEVCEPRAMHRLSS